MSVCVAGRNVGGVFAMGIEALYGANWSDARILTHVTTNFTRARYTDESRDSDEIADVRHLLCHRIRRTSYRVHVSGVVGARAGKRYGNA